MGIELYPHQEKAIKKLKNGSILCGGVGTGKSRTALAYYFFKECKASMRINGVGSFHDMFDPKDLYIITTAKKRDSKEWSNECIPFHISENPENSLSGVKVTIDSWNNIQKYQRVTNAFFIFDEQRVVGSGAWVKAFLKIARQNHWILLSATPGDTWTDYIPVFVANGFYRNKTEFLGRHAIFDRFAKYPKINRYVDEGELMQHRNDILVTMAFEKSTVPHHMYCACEYSRSDYMMVVRERWDIYENEPIQETGKLFYLMRKVVNSSIDRVEVFKTLLQKHPKTIVFYNFDYELELLRSAADELDISHAEWNGKKHEEVPTGDSWTYFVQYSAGAEGWNCITTDTLIFYSQNYSYRMTVQAAGRIDRMNTKFKDLYYYHLKSSSPIDIAIARALKNKKNFNERSFVMKT